MPVLVDTNVLLDIATEDPEWFDWSVARLAQAANRDGLAINPIVYAELSVHYEWLEAALSGHPFARLALPWDAAFVAGMAASRRARQVASHCGRGGRSPDLPVPGKQKPIGRMASWVASKKVGLSMPTQLRKRSPLASSNGIADIFHAVRSNHAILAVSSPPAGSMSPA